MVRVAAAVVLLGALGIARTASSTPDGWLAWSSSSDGCGDAGAFAARVERALGRSPAMAASAAHVNVTARIAMAAAAGAPRWVGEVRLRGDDQRTLGARVIDRRDASCQPLVEAMAVVTALALADDGLASVPPATPAESADPALLIGESPSPPLAAAPDVARGPEPLAEAPPPEKPVPEAPPPRAAPVAALSQSTTLTPSSRRWRSGLEGGAKIGVGLLPHVAFGAQVSAYLRMASGWKVFLEFAGWQRQSSLDILGRGAAFQRLQVGLGLCPLAVTRGRWEGEACVAGDVGRLSVAGVGFETAVPAQDRLVVDAGLAAGLNRHLLGPLTAGLTVGVMAPLFRDRIGYGTTDGGVVSIYRESLVAVIGGLRLAVAF